MGRIELPSKIEPVQASTIMSRVLESRTRGSPTSGIPPRQPGSLSRRSRTARQRNLPEVTPPEVGQIANTRETCQILELTRLPWPTVGRHLKFERVLAKPRSTSDCSRHIIYPVETNSPPSSLRILVTASIARSGGKGPVGPEGPGPSRNRGRALFGQQLEMRSVRMRRPRSSGHTRRLGASWRSAESSFERERLGSKPTNRHPQTNRRKKTPTTTPTRSAFWYTLTQYIDRM